MMTQEEINKSKLNAEEDYLHTPISVLRYISDLEETYKALSRNVNILEEISELEVNDYWKYPTTLSVDEVNDKLQELGINEDIQEDWNGHDLDWSIIDPLVHNDMEFEIWGCATSGSFMFRRTK